MQDLQLLKEYERNIRELRDIIITNTVLLGQAPSPPFADNLDRRVEIFTERMNSFNVDECTVDNYGNPIGIIQGEALGKPPILLVAHMDTVFQKYQQDFPYTVSEDRLTGAGLLDNSLGVGALLSVPEIVKKLGLKFKSDIIMVGLIESLAEKNLRSIRKLLKTWQSPIRGAVCLEGGELGRLNYYSRSMRRAELICNVPQFKKGTDKHDFNSIMIMNETINRILKIRIPQRPRTEIIFSQISGGMKHGEDALITRLAFEVQSDSESIVNYVFKKITDIVQGMSHERRVELEMKEISSIKAAQLGFSHPLVSSTVEIMEELGIEPLIESSESELSIFLAKKIPAITVGIGCGQKYHMEDASVEIDSIFTGLAQLIGIITSIDEGVCDE